MRQADPLTRGIEFAKGNRRLASDPLFEASNRDHNHDRSLVFHSGVGFDAHRKVAPAIGGCSRLFTAVIDSPANIRLATSFHAKPFFDADGRQRYLKLSIGPGFDS